MDVLLQGGKFQHGPLATKEMFELTDEAVSLGSPHVRASILQAFCAVTPPSPADDNVVSIHKKEIHVQDPKSSIRAPPKRFSVTDAFEFGTAAEERVCQQLKEDISEWFLSGFNVSIVTHGQKGSGKTGLLFGKDHDGLIYQIGAEVIDAVVSANLRGGGSGSKEDDDMPLLGISCFEVIGSHIMDLLLPAVPAERTASESALLFDGPRKAQFAKYGGKKHGYGVSTLDLTLLRIPTKDTFIRALDAACARSASWSRSKDGRGLLAKPNVSHVFVRFVLFHPQSLTASVMHFVDLAGTQGYANADQTQRKRAREINRNILSFGKLVQEIGKKQKEVLKRTGKEIHMTALRECKLSELLGSLIAGNARTIFLPCIRPRIEDYLETMSTLRVATQGMSIRSSCSTVEIDDPSKLTFSENYRQAFEQPHISMMKSASLPTSTASSRVHFNVEDARKHEIDGKKKLLSGVGKEYGHEDYDDGRYDERETETFHSHMGDEAFQNPDPGLGTAGVGHARQEGDDMSPSAEHRPSGDHDSSRVESSSWCEDPMSDAFEYDDDDEASRTYGASRGHREHASHHPHHGGGGYAQMYGEHQHLPSERDEHEGKTTSFPDGSHEVDEGIDEEARMRRDVFDASEELGLVEDGQAYKEVDHDGDSMQGGDDSDDDDEKDAAAHEEKIYSPHSQRDMFGGDVDDDEDGDNGGDGKEEDALRDGKKEAAKSQLQKRREAFWAGFQKFEELKVKGVHGNAPEPSEKSASTAKGHSRLSSPSASPKRSDRRNEQEPEQTHEETFFRDEEIAKRLTREKQPTKQSHLVSKGVMSLAQSSSSVPGVSEEEIERHVMEYEIDKLQQNYDTVAGLLKREREEREKLEAVLDDREREHTESLLSTGIEHDDMKREIIDLYGRLDILKKESRHAELFERYEMEISSLQSEVERLRSENIHVSLQFDRLQEQIAMSATSSKLSISTSGNIISSVGAPPSIPQYQKRIRKLTLENERLQRIISETKKEERKLVMNKKYTDELERKLANEAVKLEDAIRVCERKETTIRSLSERIRRLEEDRDHATLEVTEARSRMERAEDEVVQLTVDVKDLRQQVKKDRIMLATRDVKREKESIAMAERIAKYRKGFVDLRRKVSGELTKLGSRVGGHLVETLEKLATDMEHDLLDAMTREKECVDLVIELQQEKVFKEQQRRKKRSS
eukprot:TRINITY_DN603_c0_g1_i4.p1 TRINITY_DN603_c0_g1~~TRINITY_DN603_c0_g1_i4.p1  ORF type:complete len:1243 (+),score=432.73 TRINITY_DN603_c0_g1_i4:145-3729(+)